MRVVGVKQKVAFYSLNIIISVGYRVKSKRGVLFRQWANSILKQYLLNGHVINEDIHGRYLFIDDIGYIIDNSFNNIGKKKILMMKLEDTKERILKDII